jgi:hypothetical protein
MARFDVANYVDVQERINRFWSEHPAGAIRTRLMSPPDDFDKCRYEARVYRDVNDPEPAATGYAVEFAGGAGANQTSWEENCETSAIGRAFANFGYAKNRTERPSRQEMEKVQRIEDSGQMVSWSAFWAWARPLGYQDKPAVEAFLVAPMPPTPQAAKDAVESKRKAG